MLTQAQLDAWRQLCVVPPEPDVVPIPLDELADYIKAHPPGPFVPKPHFDREWHAIEWYWKSESDYHEAVMIDDEQMKTGKRWVGDVCRCQETKEPIGVSVFLDGAMRREIAQAYPSEFEQEARLAIPQLLDEIERLKAKLNEHGILDIQVNLVVKE